MKRPMGITILSALMVIGGVGLVILPILSAVGLREGAQRSGEGFEGPLLVLGTVLLGVLALGAGIGMFRGARWGWSLATFYFMYAAARSAVALVAMQSLLESAGAGEAGGRGAGFYFVKFGGRILVSVLLYRYLFRSNVREYWIDPGGGMSSWTSDSAPPSSWWLSFLASETRPTESA